MKTIFLTMTALSLASTLAMAQQSPSPAPTMPPAQAPSVQPPEIAAPGVATPPTNGFSEMQAKERLKADGFTNPSTLARNADGEWRGTATKDGRTVNITVDRRGQVIQQ